MITILHCSHFEPLDQVELKLTDVHSFEVRDGQGRVYQTGSAGTQTFIVGGALGTHVIFGKDEQGAIVSEASFRVDCESKVHDESGVIESLLDSLRYTLESWLDGVGNDFTSRFNKKTYRYFVCWLRDHVHTLKGQKYFLYG